MHYTIAHLTFIFDGRKHIVKGFYNMRTIYKVIIIRL